MSKIPYTIIKEIFGLSSPLYKSDNITLKRTENKHLEHQHQPQNSNRPDTIRSTKYEYNAFIPNHHMSHTSSSVKYPQ